ncbi:MAG: hypothetical protein GF375_03185, partial [Candidatus Omnitrophica bacterium]|nr:hypothetical protein [Candidatus Omnitrophota bacterium]
MAEPLYCFLPIVFMDISGLNNICIIGWGKSGIGLCKLLAKLKKKVRVSESAERKRFGTKLIDYFAGKGVKFEFGGHSRKYIKDSDLVVLSPGVDIRNSSAVKTATECGVPFTGEIEFSSRFTRARIIGITGTNGKTTTAYLTH